ncbi:MAG TPA: hypothetical protein VMT19_08035 [Thermoanaerobaculaceae bacterium]|nr:hypothetical protein [Thermoanaerobaculaceae bacterium]
MTGAELLSLAFAQMRSAPRRDGGDTALAPWDTLASWLPEPPCAVLVLASNPEPVASALSERRYRPVRPGADLALGAGGQGELQAAVLVVDSGDLEVTRSLMRAAAAALPLGGSLVAAWARSGGADREPDGAHLLLDECAFQILERRQQPLAGRAAGGAAAGDIVCLVRARRDRFTIREYRDGDESAILPMFAASFGTPRSEAHWRWKFRDDPYGTLRITEVFDEESKLVAHYAGYPVRFVWPSRGEGEIPAMQIGDTMTSKAVRATGLGKTSVLARMVDDFYERHCIGRTTFNYGFNTGHIRKLGERYLGYGYISPVTMWRRPLRTTRDLLPAARARLLGYRARPARSVGPEWDGFFARVAPAYGLLVQRDARYLTWRYLSCPDGVHHLVEVRRRGALVGWGVAAARDRSVVLGDALFDPHHAAPALAALLSQLPRLFAGADTVQGWFPKQPAWWVARLRATGFAPGPEPNALAPGFALFAPTPGLSDFEDHWYYTTGDSDLF